MSELLKVEVNLNIDPGILREDNGNDVISGTAKVTR